MSQEAARLFFPLIFACRNFFYYFGPTLPITSLMVRPFTNELLCACECDIAIGQSNGFPKSKVKLHFNNPRDCNFFIKFM